MRVPCTVEQDEDGVWCAHAHLDRVGCNGEGDTREEALADLREAVLLVLEDSGASEELTVVLDGA
ncbi:type II toxin-antitoxin system HicB family antitoxin [Frankia canadensis]|uniref:type II toxin-antitoxin system HicB family antitoxin n=1 Tax=Frankia canadensis TaxID=1836972 RepID=UPI001FB02162|nr:type II toxin-antitoxin system HicB family antitoxin [Frankia canadensis]